MPKPAITLKEAPHKRAAYETQMRYDVLLHGQYFGDLYHNMRGYQGYLPLPSGRSLDLGECSLAAYRREITRLNQEWAAHAPQAVDA